MVSGGGPAVGYPATTDRKPGPFQGRGRRHKRLSAKRLAFLHLKCSGDLTLAAGSIYVMPATVLRARCLVCRANVGSVTAVDAKRRGSSRRLSRSSQKATIVASHIMSAMQDKAPTEPAVASRRAITWVASGLVAVRLSFMLSSSKFYRGVAIGRAGQTRQFF